MKTFLVLAVIVATMCVSSTTGRCEEYWIKAYGGGGEDTISVVRQTSDGGFIAGGTTSSFVPTGSEIMVIKLDAGGNAIWRKAYGTREYAELSSIRETSDGGYIVAGNQHDGTPQYGNAWIFKLNGNGGITWQKTYGGNGCLLYSIEQTDDGGYIAAGEYASESVLQGIWIVKLDGSGEIEWQKGFVDRVMGKSIQQTSDGGFILLGRPTYGNSQIIVIRLDSTGAVIWKKTYANMCSFTDFDIYPGSIAGEYGDSMLTFYCGGSGSGVLRLLDDGGVLWSKVYSEGDAQFSAIQQTSDSEYIIAGRMGTDALVLQLNDYRVITWQKKYGGSNADYANSVQQAIDGGYVVGGSTRSFGAGGTDGWALKIDGNGAIPGCSVISHNAESLSDMPGPWTIGSCCGEVAVGTVAVTDTDCIPRDISAVEQGICSYSIPDDIDGDGTLNYLDNCPKIPNGPAVGICRRGTLIGATCTSNEACGLNGYCLLNQEESACVCVSDFDCDLDADGSDAVKIKSDFGRYLLTNPCSNENPCNGDFTCDSDVDGRDVAQFKTAFGRFWCGAGAFASDGYSASCMSPCFDCVDGIYTYTCTY
jgi:hypothetical protein